VEAHVDASSACVRLSDESWPFELDCADASTVLELGGRSLRIRPLRWREKLALARFAHLGATRVKEQHVRLALGGAPPPSAEAERAVVAALAAWVDAPREEAVPLETGVLAGVTFDVCRAMGLTPADLDGRDAYEVEALWRLAGGAAEWPRPVAGSSGRPSTSADFAADLWESELTRIDVVPDEEEPDAVAETASARSDVGQPPASERDAVLKQPAVQPDRVETGPRTPETPSARGFALLGEEAALDLLPQSRRRDEPIVERAVLDGQPAAEAREHGGGEPLERTVERVASRPLEFRSTSQRAEAGPRTPAARTRPAVRSSDDVAAIPVQRPIPAAAEQADERLFDELADRLDRAASALGVDLEA
jgi:hypothetical protein